MISVFTSRVCILLLSSTVVALSSLPSRAEPQRIRFPYDDVSDLRGFLNLVKAFEVACLNQPVTPDLPEKLLPADYRIVTSSFHLMGIESPNALPSAVLSKTGQEDSDFAAGAPIIHMTMPTNKNPSGECGAAWSRAWDYKPPLDLIILDMAVHLDARISYYLGAVLDTKPDEGFAVADRYGLVSDWRTMCWAGKPCGFQVLLELDPGKGIYMTINRRGVGSESITKEP